MDFSNQVRIIFNKYKEQRRRKKIFDRQTFFVLLFFFNIFKGHSYKGKARTQSPTIKNYAFELPTFGVIVGVNQTEVQWKGLTLEEPPS